jgi:hypothetical protein
MSMGERAVEEREMDHSPESMPPLEDMSHVPVLASRAGYSQQNTFTSSQDEFSHQTAFHQTFNDQRTVNVDQRQVHMTQHHVHGPDPSLIGNLAASAATSAVRAEATEAVAQAREVAHAVASDLRVSQARESFMDLELRNLRAQVEALRHENTELRSSRNAALAAAPDSASGQNPNNGSELEQRVREMELHIVSGITPRIDYLEQVAMMMGNIESSISQRSSFAELGNQTLTSSTAVGSPSDIHPRVVGRTATRVRATQVAGTSCAGKSLSNRQCHVPNSVSYPNSF